MDFQPTLGVKKSSRHPNCTRHPLSLYPIAPLPSTLLSGNGTDGEELLKSPPKNPILAPPFTGHQEVARNKKMVHPLLVRSDADFCCEKKRSSLERY